MIEKYKYTSPEKFAILELDFSAFSSFTADLKIPQGHSLELLFWEQTDRSYHLDAATLLCAVYLP